MAYVTNRPIKMNMWGGEFTIAKGTPLILIKGADGLRGDLFAVANPQYLIELTGNSHDPIYRYCFVEHEDAVEVKAAIAEPAAHKKYTITVEAVTTYQFQVEEASEEAAREHATIAFPETADVSQWEKDYDWTITAIDEIE